MYPRKETLFHVVGDPLDHVKVPLSPPARVYPHCRGVRWAQRADEAVLARLQEFLVLTQGRLWRANVEETCALPFL